MTQRELDISAEEKYLQCSALCIRNYAHTSHTDMIYYTWRENGKSYVYEDNYIFDPINGDCWYMSEELFQVSYREPIKSQIIIQEF